MKTDQIPLLVAEDLFHLAELLPQDWQRIVIKQTKLQETIMKDYLITYSSAVTYQVIIRAIDEDTAIKISENLEPDNFFCEETCLELIDSKEIFDSQDYDLPKY